MSLKRPERPIWPVVTGGFCFSLKRRRRGNLAIVELAEAVDELAEAVAEAVAGKKSGENSAASKSPASTSSEIFL